MMKAETDWKKEAMLLSRLNHKNIVKFEDVFVLLSKESLSYPCILTEYCEVMLFYRIKHKIFSNMNTFRMATWPRR